MKEVTESKISLKPIFGDNFNSFLFKTNIRVYGKDFSGLLVTKQLQPKNYRVIFTTELGMKIFDFEFKDTLFTLHYCVPQFNKPKLLDVIRQDIEILLMNELENKKYVQYIDKQKTYNVFRIDYDKRSNYYFSEISSNNIVKIEHSKKRTIKTIFTLNDHKDGFPTNIIIQHYNLKLKIELNLLKN
ncbi:MAG: hypothetical protein ACT4ON_16270 [Bacteroidota bacterium]